MALALELDQPSIDVSLELNQPNIDLALELDQPSIDVALELDQPSIDLALELGQSSIDVALELDKYSIDVSVALAIFFWSFGLHTFKYFCFQGTSWSWLYVSWIYNYMYNQCLSPLQLWIQLLLMAKCTRCNIMW